MCTYAHMLVYIQNTSGTTQKNLITIVSLEKGISGSEGYRWEGKLTFHIAFHHHVRALIKKKKKLSDKFTWKHMHKNRQILTKKTMQGIYSTEFPNVHRVVVIKIL